MDLIADDLAQPVVLAGAVIPQGGSLQSDRIDLLTKLVLKPRCPRSTENEIVVCAPNQEEFRLRPLPQTFEQIDSESEIGVGRGATLGAGVQASQVGGWQSNRVMVRFKLKL